jgi:hypothetical protein
VSGVHTLGLTQVKQAVNCVMPTMTRVVVCLTVIVIFMTSLIVILPDLWI